ncbi:HNH endonuclease [Oceanobacillus sojae]|uniref:HNH endonuclease n=1 Tax=Oceanobacillus sojae TaxID=582851 RepID=UPI0009886249|nr:HNH endonuclease [Oceanobacillus sojae]
MTKDSLYTEMYEKYQEGLSLSEVGEIYGITRQSVYSGFKRRGFTLRSKECRPFKMFDGVKFSLRNHGYYSRTDGDRKLMHRYVWEYYNGKIPENHDIHHKDHDRSNNDISNLELYSKSDHARLFSTGSNQFIKRPYKEMVQ